MTTRRKIPWLTIAVVAALLVTRCLTSQRVRLLLEAARRHAGPRPERSGAREPLPEPRRGGGR